MRTVDDLEVAGRTVLVRADLNVPLDSSSGSPVITDDKRIQASVPTIRDLVGRGAKVVVMAHLGRPKGEVKPELSLRPVAERLSELLGQPVGFPADANDGDRRCRGAGRRRGDRAGRRRAAREPAVRGSRNQQGRR